MYNNGSHSLCYQLFLQTLLQNEVKSNVARFSHVQTCLATNQVVSGCKNLLQKVESSSTFWNKIWACCSFYLPKANLFCSKGRSSCIWRDSRVILYNQKSVFMQIAACFVCCKTGKKLGGKTSNIASQHVLQQLAHICCPFPRSFRNLCI